ncbi:hypothetical protein [Paraburkholderia caribensis]|uniref:Uncharacterized protein n=1 Tax=Paraburkholderia caribensis TaxID=75105 RepID=A0ABV0E5K0_9BURK|nr:hypothetical protein [Paraburkholderia caribensis]MCO4880604.1 hypothetical protein [Paraburkholderia caribensis]MDR6385761.1 hypothetical protein [Paraburkholderia caribensis]
MKLATMVKRSGARCFRRSLQMAVLMAVLLAASAAYATPITEQGGPCHV